LAGAVLKEAGAPADGKGLNPEALKKAADAFAKLHREKFKTDPPATAAGLDRQRREVEALDLAAPARAQVLLVLGAVEGEFLRAQQKGSAWHAGKEPSAPGAAVAGENPFGFAFNPFRPPAKDKGAKDQGPQSLAEVLYRAGGRPLVLATDPAAVQEALGKLVDPDLARGTDLLKANKGDEADGVLLGMMKRHAGNHFLTVQVATQLQKHGRTAALASLLKPQLDQLELLGVGLPRDARLYNLLGVAALDVDVNKAVMAFHDALRCDLKYGPAYLNLAQAYRQANKLQESRLCLRRYLKLFPKGELADDARRRLTAAGDDNGPGGR
jgi:hypothetical protein